jgi:hypothetical protein
MATSVNSPLQDLLPMELPLTRSAEGSRARMSATPAKALALRGIGLGFGVSSPVLLASFDRKSFSWRTRQGSLAGGWAEFSQTWPHSGSMQSGMLSALPSLALPIIVSAYGWWPTPRAGGNDNCGGSAARRKARLHGTYIGRKMHPHVSEWLMGFPTDWTDLEPLETP